MVVPVVDANQPATVILAGPAVPPYVAMMVVCPGWLAVTRAVCAPVGATLATPGDRVPHTTGAVTGTPLASRIVAVSDSVSSTSNESLGGVTVTVKLPNVTAIGTSPVSGCNTSVIVGFVPGWMSIVTAPLWVAIPPASNARRVMVRLEPEETVMAPVAWCCVTGMLKTRDGVMSAAATSTTTVATAVPDRSARTSSVASATTRGRVPVGSVARHETATNAANDVAAIRRAVCGTRPTALR